MKTIEKEISKLEISADFGRLDRKTKHEISQKVLAEIEAEYDFNLDVEATQEELLGQFVTAWCSYLGDMTATY